ncbi:MAG: helix-turn-helix domain-containing protein [Clostridia bacterium]|nr:helix-turn-helix domain-containing protein [Clostridia bacterium]
MNRYVTGAMIRQMREKKNMTQEDLAARLFVSGKAISKWETGQGLPDISLLEPLAQALEISIIELFSGQSVVNHNRASNMLRSVLYVCPVCGNSVFSLGQAVVSCCGITLPPLEAEEPDEAHEIRVEISDGDYYVTIDHPMEKTHSITSIIAVSDSGCQIAKQYPEGNAQARLRMDRVRWIYAYCNRHGLFRVNPRALGRKKP